MIDHRRAEELAVVALDFDLTDDDQSELSRHLASCSACRAIARSLREEAEALRSLAWAQAAPSVRAVLSEAVHSAARTTGPHLIIDRSGQREPLGRGGTILRVAFLAAVVGALLLSLALAGLLAGGRTLAVVETPPPSLAAEPWWFEAGSPIRSVVPVCQDASGLTAAGDSLWFTCSGSLWKLAVTASGESIGAQGPIGRSGYRLIGPLADRVSSVAGGSGRVFAISGGQLLVIDPESGSVLRRVSVPGAASIAAATAALWIAEPAAGMVLRLDPSSDTVDAVVPVGMDPSDIAVGGGFVWVVNRGADSVSEIDPSSNQVVATLPTGSRPGAIVVATGGGWVANEGDGTLTHLAGPSAPVATLRLGAVAQPFTAAGLAAQNGRWIWVANAALQTLDRVDSTTGALADRLALPGFTSASAKNGLGDIAAFSNRVWVADVPAGVLMEVDTGTP